MTRMPINRKSGSQSTQNGEAGFTIIELVIVLVLTSILGTFVFQIVTNSLKTSITMRTRKERADDAVLVLEKISREVKEAKTINSASSNTLIFEKNVTSSADTNKWVRFVRDTTTKDLMRQSASDESSVLALPADNTSGSILAKNVSTFTASKDATDKWILLVLQLEDGSDWETKVYPRNYNLPPP